jgi:alkylhydroperoxidase/carboxymuconolactone decarboxylase family protein YurZ
LADPETAPISNKLKSLLKIAGKVQSGGKNVLAEDVEAARKEGATDIEIHDTVLIAAAFCMFNRYVDGLATWQPDNEAFYDKMGEQRAREGYKPTSINFTLTEELKKS